eukprot:301343-Chlamydomonas_euryale.AAC.4
MPRAQQDLCDLLTPRPCLSPTLPHPTPDTRTPAVRPHLDACQQAFGDLLAAVNVDLLIEQRARLPEPNCRRLGCRRVRHRPHRLRHTAEVDGAAEEVVTRRRAHELVLLLGGGPGRLRGGSSVLAEFEQGRKWVVEAQTDCWTNGWMADRQTDERRDGWVTAHAMQHTGACIQVIYDPQHADDLALPLVSHTWHAHPPRPRPVARR